MIRPRLHVILRNKLSWWSVMVLVLAMAIPTIAGVAVGPVLTNAAAAEQHRISMFYEAQKSEQEKLRVGQARYKSMLTNRAKIVAEMASEVAVRQQTVNIPYTSTRDADKLEPRTWTVSLLGIGVIGLFVLGFRYYLSCQDAKDLMNRKF